MLPVVSSFCLFLILFNKFEAVTSSHFSCSDGSEIEVENVCDGIAHCANSLDETAKLCHRITCPVSKFRCAYGACISRNKRCDGALDCFDGSDEFYCDETSCSEHKFRCSTSSECISDHLVCDGVSDCTDGSDENLNVCKDYICPDNTFQCAYGGCIPNELICDKIKDCVDGSDESNHTCPVVNCQGTNCHKLRCSAKEFACKSRNQCIPLKRLCDGTHQCHDASDESDEECKGHKCPEGKFRCKYGACISMKSRCNGQQNCRDWSDEDEHTCGPAHPLPDGACSLPLISPGISYNILSGCDRCRPGDVAPEFTRLEFTCHNNLTIEGEKTVRCQSNKWLPQLPTCPSTENDTIECPPVKSRGTSQRCKIMSGPKQGWTQCNEPMPIGSQVTLECLDYYERKRGSSHLTCLHNGLWSQTPLSCQPVCGVRPSSSIALIVNGWNAPYQEPIPWHATLFSLEDGKWNFFCGGTLITESIVLSAAHCVFKTTPETIRVLLGSNSSNYLEQNSDAQERSVVQIKVQSSYHDQEGNYNSDLALLILNETVKISSNILPACLDWNNKHNIENRAGEIGVIVGMGVTENETFSPSLRMTSAEFVSEEVCREKVKRDFRKYLTYSSFCAGWANGTSVCNGDSGGGFFLQNPGSEIWEIHGIVSLSPRKLGTSLCDPFTYTVFTKVFVYIDWIKRVTESILTSDSTPAKSLPNRDNIILN